MEDVINERNIVSNVINFFVYMYMKWIGRTWSLEFYQLFLPHKHKLLHCIYLIFGNIVTINVM